MRSCTSFDITVRAKSFFSDLGDVSVGHVSQFKDGAAKYAIVLGNYKLAVLRSVGFLEIIDLSIFHAASSLSCRSRIHAGKH